MHSISQVSFPEHPPSTQADELEEWLVQNIGFIFMYGFVCDRDPWGHSYVYGDLQFVAK